MSGSITQTRTHDKQNQVSNITITGGGWTTPTYDSDGNTTKNNVNTTFTYDAWNRLAVINSGGATRTFDYDAIHRRIREVAGTVGGGGGGDSLIGGGEGASADVVGDPISEELELSTAPGGPGDRESETGEIVLQSLTFPSSGIDYYYNVDWQMVEEVHNGDTKYQYIWSATYIDALMIRDEDVNDDGTTTDYSTSPPDERLWRSTMPTTTSLRSWTTRRATSFSDSPTIRTAARRI